MVSARQSASIGGNIPGLSRAKIRRLALEGLGGLGAKDRTAANGRLKFEIISAQTNLSD